MGEGNSCLEHGGGCAVKLGFRDSKTNTAVEKFCLQRLESGVKKPSVSTAQLNKMSVKAYYQPLLVFYLIGEPPRKGDRGEDFRTAEEQSYDRKANARLDLLMRNVSAAQSLVRHDLLEEELTEPLPFVGTANLSMGERAVSENHYRNAKFRSHKRFSFQAHHARRLFLSARAD